MIVPTNTRITPARPGIMMYDVLSSGLYRICTLADDRRAARAGGRAARSADSAGSASCAVEQLAAVDEHQRSRPRPGDDRDGGVPVPQLVLRPGLAALAAGGVGADQLERLGRAFATAAAPGPATTVGMVVTSKLAA